QRTAEDRIKAQSRTWQGRDIVDDRLWTRRYNVQEGHFRVMAYGFLTGTPDNVRCHGRQVCWNEHMGEVHDGSPLPLCGQRVRGGPHPNPRPAPSLTGAPHDCVGGGGSAASSGLFHFRPTPV